MGPTHSEPVNAPPYGVVPGSKDEPVAYGLIPERRMYARGWDAHSTFTTTHELQTIPGVDAIRSRVVSTSRVRLELLLYRSEGTVHWSAIGPELSLVLMRNRTKEPQITISGGSSERLGSGRAKFWFFPEGIGAQGELQGMGPFDCAGIFVDPSVLPSTVKAFFSQPVSGLADWRLRPAFDVLTEDLKGCRRSRLDVDFRIIAISAESLSALQGSARRFGALRLDQIFGSQARKHRRKPAGPSNCRGAWSEAHEFATGAKLLHTILDRFIQSSGQILCFSDEPRTCGPAQRHTSCNAEVMPNPPMIPGRD